MNNNLPYVKHKYFRAILLFLFIISCSTQKDAALNRIYHQLNTKYNGLFYASEHLKEGIKKLNKSHQDNYKEIISINKLSNLKGAQSAKASFDQAIEKSTLAIRKHSMDIDGEEKNKLIDKNYFIIGQAKFYKQEYIPALNTFNYIARKSSSTEMQTKAAIWATLTQQQLDNTEAVRKNITILKEDYYLSLDQESILHEIEAELAIKQKYYLEAKEQLLKALNKSKDKNKKIRIHYILGQLSLLTNEPTSALYHFTKVVKKNPTYELVFNAKLNKANTYTPNKNNFDELESELNKMLKDKKNNEYKDQIYFALAKMNLKNQDTISAIQSLELSTKSFIYNSVQKLESHHTLANIFWDQKEYVRAYNHCDSAYQLIEPTDLKYNDIKKMLRSSKKIAQYYNIINHNDSIVDLARLPEDERNKIIDEYIAKLKEQEQKLKLVNEQGPTNNKNFNSYEYNKQTQNSMNITSGGGWYFYNPSAISLGYSEFLSRWGNRKLENNWRRKNKNQILSEETLEGDSLVRPPDEKEKYNRDYYISQLPLEEEKQLILLSKMETAYYDLAGVFKEDLQDYNQSIALYYQLIDRFPSTDYKQLIYFDLYHIYNLKGDSIKSSNFIDKIKTEYPQSNYLQILKGETPVDTKLEHDKKTYRQAHDLYTTFSKNSCNQLNEIYQTNQNNIFIAQIEVLNAFCQAKKSEKKEFIAALEIISKKYPETLISNKVDSIILILKGEIDFNMETMYTNEFESPHYFFLVIQDISINLPETQSAISKFNKQNYKLDSLEIINLLLTKDLQLLKVEDFKNKTEALIYYETIQESNIAKQELSNKQITPFIISKNNFSQLLTEKNINEYKAYFNTIYLLN